MEFETNNEPEVALKILKAAKASFPDVTLHDKEFFRLWMKVLTRLGDIEELRDLFKNLLDDVNSDALSTFSPQERLRVFEDYFAAEIHGGMLSYKQLHELRNVRKKIGWLTSPTL